jgi:fucose permease
MIPLHTSILILYCSYVFISNSLEIVVWRVASLIGNAVAVSLVGLVLAPMYPLCMTLGGRMLPRKLRAGGIGE